MFDLLGDIARGGARLPRVARRLSQRLDRCTPGIPEQISSKQEAAFSVPHRRGSTGRNRCHALGASGG
jgi:hypothetical protein